MSICRWCSSPFQVGRDDLQFFSQISPTFASHIQEVKPPTLCPDCRLQRRLAFRNERHLYRNRSCISGKEMVSVIRPGSPYKVVTYDEWWSDQWDPFQYGRQIDFTIPFFEQLRSLSVEVPHCPLYIRNPENSEYTNYALNMKDCYLVFGAGECDHCLYSKCISQAKNIVDCLSVTKSELCYEGVSSEACYRCMFFLNCISCIDCLFVEDCEHCTNCALCFGLYRKEYHVLNQYVGKAKYEEFLASIKPLNKERIQECFVKLAALSKDLPHRESYGTHRENCTGNNISHSKNCQWCFDIQDCEDCKYLYWSPKGLNSYDCCFNSPGGVELCYEACSTLGQRCMGTFMCWDSSSTYYSIECHNCKDVLGCVGLRHAQYCILNTQYSKDEYERLAAKIVSGLREVGQWGEYLPSDLSLFSYNETIAHEHFPMQKEEAKSLGFSWFDESQEPDSAKSRASALSENTRKCEATGNIFRLVPSELNFYQMMELPLPHLCPDERHKHRVQKRFPLTLFSRKCAKTGVQIWTGYSPANSTIVYSNEAYREMVNG